MSVVTFTCKCCPVKFFDQHSIKDEAVDDLEILSTIRSPTLHMWVYPLHPFPLERFCILLTSNRDSDWIILTMALSACFHNVLPQTRLECLIIHPHDLRLLTGGSTLRGIHIISFHIIGCWFRDDSSIDHPLGNVQNVKPVLTMSKLLPHGTMSCKLKNISPPHSSTPPS